MNKPITPKEMTAYVKATWNKCQEKAWQEQKPVCFIRETAWSYEIAPWDDPKGFPVYTAPPKREQDPWTPVEIGVDVTEEGTHVVGMYVLMPDVVRYVFYSKFHSAPKREWVGLTEDEAFACKGRDYFDTYKTIEAKLKEKNT